MPQATNDNPPDVVAPGDYLEDIEARIDHLIRTLGDDEDQEVLRQHDALVELIERALGLHGGLVA